MVKIFILFFLASSTFTNTINTKPDPLSKIVITSNKAICQKKKDKKNSYLFTYLENVLVTFADKSTIKSDELELQLDTTQAKKKLDSNITNTDHPKTNLSQFKKITFKNNVFIKRVNRTIQADRAELFLQQKKCQLFDNIKIEQTKINPKDLPMQTLCSQAMIDMQTEQITFLGDNQKPVSTTITLEDHPGLLKKVKTKAEKKAERKAARKLRRLARKK